MKEKLCQVANSTGQPLPTGKNLLSMAIFITSVCVYVYGRVGMYGLCLLVCLWCAFDCILGRECV